jgi:hypothetical protein
MTLQISLLLHFKKVVILACFNVMIYIEFDFLMYFVK